MPQEGLYITQYMYYFGYCKNDFLNYFSVSFLNKLLVNSSIQNQPPPFDIIIASVLITMSCHASAVFVPGRMIDVDAGKKRAE